MYQGISVPVEEKEGVRLLKFISKKGRLGVLVFLLLVSSFGCKNSNSSHDTDSDVGTEECDTHMGDTDVEEDGDVDEDSVNYCEDTGDEEENECWFRDLRFDSWEMLIGNESGLRSVQEKLERMYGHLVPETTVDLANTEFSEGNWHYEFVQLAEQAVEDDDLIAAMGYYTLASYPQIWGDERAPGLYELALDTFEEALEVGEYPYEEIEIYIEGNEIEAYLVYPQSFENGDSVPVVIETGGIDGLMTIGFAEYLLHWNEENIAWVGFDLPGYGTSRALNLTYEAERVHLEVIEELRVNDNIDNENIFLYGRSMGGFAGLRLLATQAGTLDIAGIAAFGAVGESALSDEDMIDHMPAMTRNALGRSLGIDPEDGQALFEASIPFRFSEWLDVWPPTEPVSSVPLIVYNGEHDMFSPPFEVEQMASLSENGRFEIEKDGDHCGTRSLGLPVLAQFVAENLR